MRKLFVILFITPLLINAQQIDTVLSFGPDTVMYTLDGKATGIDAYYMNTVVEYTGYAQYFDAPQELEISGFCFYAWVENTGQTADVLCSIHEALGDSLPGMVIDADTLTVDDTFSAGDIELIRYCAQFDTPIVRDQPFVLSVQTNSALDLNIISNDAANEDGADEALAMYYWSGTDPGWRKNETFFAWDIDWVLCPIVNFDFAVQATFDADTICQEDTLNVQSSTPAIWSHRMYNSSAFDGDEWQDVSWLIDQNPPFLGYNASAEIQSYGDVPVALYVEYNGWRNTTMFPLSEDIYAFPQPQAGFDYTSNVWQVQFNDTSWFADSVHWDFGGGTIITDPMPIRNYPGPGAYQVELIAFNDCGSDTTTVVIQLVSTGIADPKLPSLKVFPNPASDILNVLINGAESSGTLSLIDVTGRVVLEQNTNSSGVYLIELDGRIKSGTYQLRSVTKEKTLSTTVIISR